jgi:hypothetical protein
MVGGFAGIVNDMADRFFIKWWVPSDHNPMFQLGIYGGVLKLAVLLLVIEGVLHIFRQRQKSQELEVKPYAHL